MPTSNRQTSRDKNYAGWVLFTTTLVVLLALFGFAATTRTNEAADLGEAQPQWESHGGGGAHGLNAGFIPGWRLVVDRPAASRQELIDRITQITDAAPGTYGVYIHELDTGQGFGINTDMRFEAASTNKVPILIRLYKEIELGNISREQTLTYMWGDFEDGSGSIQTTSVGSQWTVARLAELMMAESDNIAKNMLFRLLGYGQVESFARELGSDFDVYNNRTTPRDMANLLRLVYEGGIVSEELSYEMMGLMIDTMYEDRLPRYLDDIPVANKIGTWSDSISDVGIVMDEKHPFVICIYSTAAGSEAAAADNIALIAAHAYAYEVNR